MSSILYKDTYHTKGSTYFIVSVLHPFPSTNSSDLPHFLLEIDGSHLLTDYLDFVKPKEAKWVKDIEIRSDPGIDRRTFGLTDAYDTTYLALTEKGEIAASFSVYSSQTDSQAGLVAHIRTHDVHRQRGLSSVLGEIAHQEWYRDNPERFLILHVTNPHAHRLYQKQGYVTLVGKISDKEEDPGEVMARPADTGRNIYGLIDDRYGKYDTKNLVRRPIIRSDLAGFITLFAAEGRLDARINKLKMNNSNSSEDCFTTIMLENSQEMIVEGIFKDNNILVGVTVFPYGKPEDCESYLLHL